MTPKQKEYKQKVVRKYVEFSPAEKELLEFVESVTDYYGIPFATFVKRLIKKFMEDLDYGSET